MSISCTQPEHLAQAATGPPSPPTHIRHNRPANAVRWPARRAKPRGIKSYRIAEEAIGRRPRTGCSNQAGGNEKFFPAAVADDPRAPFPSRFRRHFPEICPSGECVPDSGATVRDDRPSPSRWRGTSAEPDGRSTGVPFPGTHRYSSTFARTRGGSNAHSTDTGATAAGTEGIESPVRIDQTEGGPREVPLPKGQVSGGSDNFDPRRLFFTAALP